MKRQPSTHIPLKGGPTKQGTPSSFATHERDVSKKDGERTVGGNFETQGIRGRSLLRKTEKPHIHGSKGGILGGKIEIIVVGVK